MPPCPAVADGAQRITGFLARVSERQVRIAAKCETSCPSAVPVNQDEGFGAGFGHAKAEPRDATIPNLASIETVGGHFFQQKVGEVLRHPDAPEKILKVIGVTDG